MTKFVRAARTFETDFEEVDYGYDIIWPQSGVIMLIFASLGLLFSFYLAFVNVTTEVQWEILVTKTDEKLEGWKTTGDGGSKCITLQMHTVKVHKCDDDTWWCMSPLMILSIARTCSVIHITGRNPFWFRGRGFINGWILLAVTFSCYYGERNLTKSFYFT